VVQVVFLKAMRQHKIGQADEQAVFPLPKKRLNIGSTSVAERIAFASVFAGKTT